MLYYIIYGKRFKGVIKEGIRRWRINENMKDPYGSYSHYDDENLYRVWGDAIRDSIDL